MDESGADMRADMRAVVIREHGGPEVLEVRSVPRPEPGRGQIRVAVAASGVNRADLIQRQGHYPAPPGWPQEIPGLEFAGTVDAVGPDATLWSEGDRVMGLLGGGGYAEAVVVHERMAVAVPGDMDFKAAGAVPEVFMTAYDALVRQMGLTAGETVLIHAVGSGVGTAALQLARAAGARTIGTSRTPEKVERALELGLDAGVVAADGWVERILDATRGEGVDVILDLVGAAYLEANQKLLAHRGRWIVVGVPGGSSGTIDLRGLMAKRARIQGTVLRARPPEEKMALARDFADHVTPFLEAGLVRPVVDTTFEPDEAAEAHRRMEANLNFGKLLLLWG